MKGQSFLAGAIGSKQNSSIRSPKQHSLFLKRSLDAGMLGLR